MWLFPITTTSGKKWKNIKIPRSTRTGKKTEAYAVDRNHTNSSIINGSNTKEPPGDNWKTRPRHQDYQIYAESSGIGYCPLRSEVYGWQCDQRHVGSDNLVRTSRKLNSFDILDIWNEWMFPLEEVCSLLTKSGIIIIIKYLHFIYRLCTLSNIYSYMYN